MAIDLIQEQLKAGVQAHVRGNLIAAANAYKTVLELDQANATAHNNLGFVYGQQGQWNDALSHLHMATEIKPDYATAFSNMGQIYFSLGDADKAFELLEKSVVMDASDPQNWHNLARLCLLVGNFQRAEYAWWRAHNLRPDYADYSVNLGIAIAAQKRFVDAEKVYQSVLSVNPSHFNALLQLGICWLLMNNYGNAKNILLRAYRLNSNDVSVLRHLALVELTLGDKPQAAYYFKKLVEVAPDDQTARVDYALVLLDMSEFALLEQERKVLRELTDASERTIHYLGVIDGVLDTREIH